MTIAAEELRRLACVNFVNFAGRMTIEELTSRRWASITFSGERHRMVLRLQGSGARAAAQAFLADLGEREFELKDHILVDIALLAMDDDRDDSVLLTLEALTVEMS